MPSSPCEWARIVREGQTLFVTANIEHAPLARALARAGYAAGARYVDVRYVDPHIRRAMIEHGPDEALTHTPDWLKTRMYGYDGAASVGITGDAEPDLLADLDGDRVGRARMAELNEIARELMIKRAINWTGVAFPNEGWARAGVRRARRRAAVGSGRVLHAARRGRPRAGVARPHGAPRGARGADERAALRRTPLPRPRHRPHRRPARGGALDVGALPRRGRPRVPPEHADGGDLHDARLLAARRAWSPRPARWRCSATSSSS